MNEELKMMNKDWEETMLIDVCDIHDNLRKPINAKERNNRISGKKENELYPYYGATGQVGFIDDFLTDGDFVLIGEDAAPFLDYSKDVAYKISGKTWVNNHAHILKSKFNDDFLLHYLNGFNYNGYVSGTTRLKLTQGRLKQIPIKFPSLVEQKAIVKKIEQLFSSLDSGITDLKKAQEQLKIYRQAVLKKAFEGEIVLKSKKNKLVNLTTKIGSGSTPKGGQANYKSSGIPLVRSLNIHFDFIKYKGLAFIDEKQAKKLKNVIIEEGDILLNITGASIGRVNIAPKEFQNGRVNQHVSIIRPKSNLYISKFLKLFIQSSKVQNWIANVNSGATRQGLTKSSLEGLEIPVIKIQEQTEIVRKIESRLSVCDKVEQSITESLEKAKTLRQSILKKAFEGKLLSATEIAECKKDKDYEPASVLLERIKNEKLGKENTVKKTKPKKKTTTKKPSVPAKISTDIQAGVIAKIIQLHNDNPKYLDNLTHVKCEKISHLVEYHLQIPLGRVPVKDAAGPDDYNHLKKVEHRANMAGYFKVVKKEIGHTYTASRNITKAINNLEKKISTEQKEQLDNLINLFLNFDLESAEIIATLYAGWNNLLIDGKTPSDDEIVYESRENWSKRKLGIKGERFYKALNWMRKDEINLIPSGFGTKVLKPNK